jgi:cellulose synthase/poly-beta-1,6-N-acetylglucosamine synthase-like glycosyltransferase
MLSLASLMLVTFSMLAVSLYHVTLVYGKAMAMASPPQQSAKRELLSIVTPIKNEPVDVVERYGSHFSRYASASAVECIVVADYTDDKLFKDVLMGFSLSDGMFLVRRFNGVGGRNGAINDGTRFSSGSIIVLLDVDAYPSEEVLKEIAMCSSVCVARWSVCGWSPTRTSKTIAFITEYGSWLYYKLKGLRGLFVYPLGSGTAIRRELFDKVGGLRLGVIQDDMWLGTQLIHRGVKPHVVGEICVGAPQTLSAFFIQQRRWAYGTTEVLKGFGKLVLKAPVKHFQKFEALFYLSQPLLASVAGLGFILAVPASFLEAQHIGVLELTLLGMLVLSLALESLCVRKFAREAGKYDPPYVYGRSSAISTLLSIGVLPYVIAALVGVKVPYKITPKSGGTSKELTLPVAALLFSTILIASVVRGNSVTMLVAAMPLLASIYALVRLD